MMTRTERIEYEILDCCLNKTSDPEGWPTTRDAFLTQLLQLFPDAVPREFAEACKRLALAGALTLRIKEPGMQKIYRHFQGERDDEAFFYGTRREFRFQEAPMSRAHFKRLAALVDAPAGFKRPRNRFL
jgi:hypothetical protein